MENNCPFKDYCQKHQEQYGKYTCFNQMYYYNNLCDRLKNKQKRKVKEWKIEEKDLMKQMKERQAQKKKTKKRIMRKYKKK